MSQINNPHDKYFKRTMRKKANAVSLFKAYLSSKIKKQLDFKTLSIVKDSFVSKELQERFSDIVYKVSGQDEEFFIFMFLEHQSTVDKWMHVRFMGYMKEFYDFYIEQHPKIEKLPGSIPILFYHGKQPWNVSVHSWDIIQHPEAINKFIPKFDYKLLDFSLNSTLKIKGNIVLQLFLKIMKTIKSSQFKDEFIKIVPLFVKLSNQKTGMGYIMLTLKYLFETSSLKPTDIEKKLLPVIEKEKRGAIMTLGEQFEKRGEKRGEIKGTIKTLQEFVNTGIFTKDFVAKRIDECNQKLKELALSNNSVNGFQET